MIGVGIVGLSASGGWASRAHVPALRELAEDFTLVGLCGSTAMSAELASARFDVPFHTAQAHELIAHPAVSLVSVSVKVPDHATIILDAIKARKSVLCEWPLAIDLSEASHLADLAREAGIRTFIGLQSRFNPGLNVLRENIQAGKFGRILSTTATAVLGSPWDGTTDERRKYLSERRNGATMLSIPVGHFLDALTWTLGEMTDLSCHLAIVRRDVSVEDQGRFITTDVHDDISISGTLAGSASASLHFRGSEGDATHFRWSIRGELADAEFAGPQGHFQFGQSTLTIKARDPALECKIAAVPRLSSNTENMYRQIAEDLKTGSRVVADFDQAVSLHSLLEKIR